MLVKKPVIAAISGYAVAGGFELACWCDLRVVDQSAILGIYCRMRGMIHSVEELNSGVPLIDGGTFRLPRLIGLSRAMDIILTGYAPP
jgi:enoyl-CoA hydratase